MREIESQVVDLLNQSAGIGVLTQLVSIDPMKLDRAGRVDYLSALEKQTAWLQAVMQRAIVAVAGEEPSTTSTQWSDIDDIEREEVATALRLSGNTAQGRIDVARTLTQHLPNACAALAVGDISAQHATVIAKETAALIRNGISSNQLLEIESQAVAHAEFHTPAQVAAKVRSLAAQTAPENYEEVHATANACRKVNLYVEPDGMATLVALLPIADAQTIMLAIDKLARINKNNSQLSASDLEKKLGAGKIHSDDKLTVVDDKLTIDNYRADALTQLANAYLATTTDQATNHRRPVTLNLTLDLPTLLGLKENPGILAGFGPIPASIARELAADAKWRRFITDPISGSLLDLGRQVYEPPQALVDFLLARDRTCRFPGCRQPARLADIDHAQAWDDGGVTSPENLGLLCRRHHLIKTHANWQLESFPDGSCTWTSPTGKKYSVPARPLNEAV